MYDESRDLISSGFSDGKAFPAESAADHNSSIQKRLRNLGRNTFWMDCGNTRSSLLGAAGSFLSNRWIFRPKPSIIG
jgi:hypothetical protein